MTRASVIVPVYDCERYVVSCLDSLALAMDPQDEMVVVDDASVDNSVSVVQDWSVAHPEVRLVLVRHSSNQGVSAARNTGLRRSQGEFVFFVDPDDQVEVGFVRGPLAEIIGMDAVCSRYTLIDVDAGVERVIAKPRSPGEVSGVQAFMEMCAGRIASSVCFFAFRKEVLLNAKLEFAPGLRFEDFIFLSHALPRMSAVRLRADVVYRYYRRSGTETGSLRPSVRDLAVGVHAAREALARIPGEDAAWLVERVTINLYRTMYDQASALGNGSDLALQVMREARGELTWGRIGRVLGREPSLALRCAFIRYLPGLYSRVMRIGRQMRAVVLRGRSHQRIVE